MPVRSYTDEALAAAVATSHSWRGVLRELGLAATSSAAIRSVKLQAARLDLDHSHFTGQRRWTEAQLADAVANSKTWTQVADALGLSGGSTTSALKGHAARLGLDTGHFSSAAEVIAPRDAPAQPDVTWLPRAGSLMAAGWLALCGYEISWPLEPCRYDLLAGRDGQFLRIQVKTTRLWQNGGWVVSLSTTSGGRRAYDPDDIDYFFIIDGELAPYLIPVASVGGLFGITLSRYQQFRLASPRAAGP